MIVAISASSTASVLFLLAETTSVGLIYFPVLQLSVFLFFFLSGFMLTYIY